MTTQTARLIIGVYAGIIPEQPEEEFTREYAVSSEAWSVAVQTGKQTELLDGATETAQKYAAELMRQPDRLNWVRTDWIWL